MATSCGPNGPLIEVCLQSLSVKFVQWSSVIQRAAREGKWLCVVWFTILLVLVQRSGVGTRELWVNDRTLWSVPLTLKTPEFQLLISMKEFRTTARAGKCSDHGTDRLDAPPCVHLIHRFPVLIQFNYRPVRIQTMGKYRKGRSKWLEWTWGVWG